MLKCHFLITEKKYKKNLSSQCHLLYSTNLNENAMRAILQTFCDKGFFDKNAGKDEVL